jgi:hypothetical protein
MRGQGRFINRPRIVIEAPGDRQVDLKMRFRDAEIRHKPRDGFQLVQAPVERFVHAFVLR